MTDHDIFHIVMESIQKSINSSYRQPLRENTEQLYNSILRRHYPEQFVTFLLQSDEQTGKYLQGKIAHEQFGNLVVKYSVGPENVGIMGLFSTTDRVNPSSSVGLRDWMKRLLDAADQGKTIYVSVNEHSRPLFMRIFRRGDFQITSIGKLEYPWGSWETLKVKK